MKRELDKIARAFQMTKHKVRYIWDFILQGNIKELEAVITSAYHAIEHNEVEFLHLIGEFPNSRFVARAYCRFLRDIVVDHGAHKQWEQNPAAVQCGQRVVPDQAQTLGLPLFPFFPRGSEHAMTVQQTQRMVTDDALTQDIDADDEFCLSIRQKIDRLDLRAFEHWMERLEWVSKNNGDYYI
jgi:hypothetical protein